MAASFPLARELRAAISAHRPHGAIAIRTIKAAVDYVIGWIGSPPNTQLATKPAPLQLMRVTTSGSL